MLDHLPIELKLQLLTTAHDPIHHKLKYVNKEFFKLHNDLMKLRVLKLTSVESINQEIIKQYEQSLSFWNGPLSQLLQPDLNWSIVYSFITNKRIYFEPEDCVIQKFHFPTSSPPRNGTLYQPDFEIDDGTLKLHNVQALYYQKSIVLPKGSYNFQVAIINHRSSRGLGTTTFQVGDHVRSYPTTFINELIPEGSLAVLNLSRFEVKEETELLDITIEEVGMYPKIDIEICYLQFTTHAAVNNTEDDYMFYIVPSPKINPLEKLIYKNLQGIEVKPEPTIDLEWYEAYYKNGERSVKMLYPKDQRTFTEKVTRGELVHWKVPF